MVILSSFRLTLLPSVVIKVGMVGDSQIGKTSLMVKYVEGSFDEDYIQTLGTLFMIYSSCWIMFSVSCRCQFHGKDDLSTADNDYIFYMGFGWSARICEHAPSRLQRCRCHPLYV